MRRLTTTSVAILLGATFAVAFPSGASAGTSTTCSGALAPGSYGSVTVPADAVCFAAGPLTITGGLWISSGATFVLGDEEHPTPNGTITGGVHATNAANVQIHFTQINGGVRIQGGSGPFYDKTPFCFPDEETGQIVCLTFNAIEDNTINGGVVIDGYNGFWMGFIRNEVNGTVHYDNNALVDPDGNEFVTNSIHGSVSCAGNSPAPQVGDSEGDLNTVTGARTGQCANV